MVIQRRISNDGGRGKEGKKGMSRGRGKRKANEPEPGYKQASTSTTRRITGSVPRDGKRDRRGRSVDGGRE